MEGTQGQRFSPRFSLSWFRREGIWQHGLATLTGAVFIAQTVACSTADTAADDVDFGDRVVQVELVGQYMNPESGELESVSIAQDEFALADYRWHERELIVDGRRTLDVEDIYAGTETVIPLRRGGTMTVKRADDVLEVVAVDTDASYDITRFPRIRVGQNAVEVLGSEDGAGRVFLTTQGLEDLPQVERALAVSLGLDVMLASVEEPDQNPLIPIIMAAVAALVGEAWMAACGLTLATCIGRCDQNFEVKCGFLDIEVHWPRISVGGAFSFSCKCL